MASLRGCGYATLRENKQMVTHCGLLHKFTRGMSTPDPSPQQHSPEEFNEFEQGQKEWTRKKRGRGAEVPGKNHTSSKRQKRNSKKKCMAK